MNLEELIPKLQKLAAINPATEVVMQWGNDRVPVKHVELSDRDAPGVLPFVYMSSIVPTAEKHIFINGKELIVTQDVLTYEEIVRLAGETGNPSMTYGCRAAKSEGILHSGQTLSIVALPNVSLSVVHTGNA